MTIRFVLFVNKQGQTRLAQYYEHLSLDERRALEGEIVRKCLARTDQQVRPSVRTAAAASSSPAAGLLPNVPSAASPPPDPLGRITSLLSGSTNLLVLCWIVLDLDRDKFFFPCTSDFLRLPLVFVLMQCSFVEHRNYKVVYRRYASLFFLVGVDNDEVCFPLHLLLSISPLLSWE
jgi:hypothetical protein